jgi:hypothetical protein
MIDYYGVTGYENIRAKALRNFKDPNYLLRLQGIPSVSDEIKSNTKRLESFFLGSPLKNPLKYSP